MGAKIDYAHQRFCELLDEAQALFNTDMKVTLLARHPTDPNRHLMVTSDTEEGIIQGLTELPPVETAVYTDGQRIR